MGAIFSCAVLETGKNLGIKLLSSDRYMHIHVLVCRYGKLEILANVGWKFLLQIKVEAAVSC